MVYVLIFVITTICGEFNRKNTYCQTGYPVNISDTIRAVSDNWAVGDGGLILTRNASSEWTPYPISIAGFIQPNWDLQGVCEVNVNLTFIVGVFKEVSTNVNYSGPKGVILKWDGISWTAKYSMFLTTEVDGNDLAFYCVDFEHTGRYGYIGASGGYVIKTDDWGANWKGPSSGTGLTKPVPNTPDHFSDCVRSVWVDKTNSDRVWVTTDNRGCVAQTTDGGANWTKWNETVPTFIQFKNDAPAHPYGWGQSDWVNPPLNWAEVRHSNFGITGLDMSPSIAWMGLSTGGTGYYTFGWNPLNTIDSDKNIYKKN